MARGNLRLWPRMEQCEAMSDLPGSQQTQTGCPSQEGTARLGTMIQSWIKEDGGEQRETFDHLVRALDEDRLSNRKLFPEELKGKSW